MSQGVLFTVFQLFCVVCFCLINCLIFVISYALHHVLFMSYEMSHLMSYLSNIFYLPQLCHMFVTCHFHHIYILICQMTSRSILLQFFPVNMITFSLMLEFSVITVTFCITFYILFFVKILMCNTKTIKIRSSRCGMSKNTPVFRLSL